VSWRLRSGNWWLMVLGVFVLLVSSTPGWAFGMLLFLVARDNYRRQAPQLVAPPQEPTEGADDGER